MPQRISYLIEAKVDNIYEKRKLLSARNVTDSTTHQKSVVEEHGPNEYHVVILGIAFNLGTEPPMLVKGQSVLLRIEPKEHL